MRHPIIVLVMLIFIVYSPWQSAAKTSLDPDHVLLLNSYNQRMTWVKDIARAVEDELDPGNNNIVLHIANMDSKQFHSSQYFDSYKRFLKTKYANNRFSLILSSDNNAFEFLKQHRDELFSNVPIVFCGVNNFKEKQIENIDRITGVAEIFSAKNTVEMALRLHPETREIFVVNDYLETGRAWQRDIETALSPLTEKVRITYSKNLAMEELKAEIAGLDEKTIVLIGVYFSDRDGRYFTYEKVGEMISGASQVPVYCLLEFNLGKGVVGGEVISGYFQGKAMARIGKRVLAGEDPDSIPVLKKGANRIVFDFLQLERFGLSESSLPEESVLINRPYSVFREYKGQFIALFIMMGILVITIAALLLNILQRTRAEEALRESKQQLSVHLQNTPVGAILWDKEFRVMEWNPAAQTIFGYTKQEAMGRKGKGLIIPPELHSEVEEVFQKLLSGQGGTRNVNDNIRKNGERITCAWYNTTLKDRGGRITGVASLVNDITERKKTRELMIQSEKMLSVGGLAAGMAHEVNNPLAGIMQSAQVIHNRLTKDIPANTRTARELGFSMTDIRKFMEKREILLHLENISQTGNRAAKIIDNMLSFVRKSSSVKKKCSLIDLMDKAISLAQSDYDLKKEYDFRQVKIIREYFPALSPVTCEASRIQQVLFNLVKNASHALHTKKHTTAQPCITLRLWEEKPMACIEVEDNGPGMDHATCKRVFEPFFTTKNVDKGTGLGLSVSYFIVVEDHGGTMEVESTPGKGTKFIIKLPITP